MKTTKILLGVLLVIAVINYSYNIRNKGRIASTPIEEKFIAHAGGVLDGNTYTNTIKASQQSAEFNYRAIEIDFIVTSDNKLIAGHDWTTFNKQTGFADMGGNPTTFEDAKSRKYLGYDVAGADDIARFFEQHPHITLVTDKVDDYRLLDMYFSNMKDRVLVEAFSVSSYIELKRHGYVPMLSLGGSIRKLFHPRILLSGGVDWVAMGYHYMPQYKLWFMSNILGIKLALFTINDKALCETYNNYAELIYTDSLLHGLE